LNSHLLNISPKNWPVLPGDRCTLLFKSLLCEAKTLEESIAPLGCKSEDLLKAYSFDTLKVERVHGPEDGTQKILLKTADHYPVESVWLPESYKNTICLSSQSGCAYACRFCATGKMGLNRNLDTWEIVDQVLAWNRLGKKKLSNLVFMGMGEPLANLDAVLKATDIVADTRGLGLSYRKMTISTVGVTKGIRLLSEQSRQINLIVSLHGTTDEQRAVWMPRTPPLKELWEGLRYYQQRSRRRIGIAYLVKPGFNDSLEDVGRLRELLKDLNFKINLLCHNPINKEDKGTNIEDVEKFRKKIQGFVQGAVTIRFPAGREDGAACGQLAG